MLHHVALEIAPQDAPRSIEMWELIGFEVVDVPPALAERFLWVQREGTQIHLALADQPVVPRTGHAAVVVPELDVAVKKLRQAGFELSEGRAHWGARRVKVTAPGGHRVEIMEAPPG